MIKLIVKIRKMQKIFLPVTLVQITLLLQSQTTSHDIRINQVGFFPNSVKKAALINTQSDSFEIKTADLNSTVYKGQILPSVYYPSSDEAVSIADFTLFQTPGEYVIIVDDLGKSVPFYISNDVFSCLSKASLKAFYYNRASTDILSEYAGIYARHAGHPDTSVVVLPSAASAKRPAGTKISTPMGWYDAGDYNKYMVNSGISVYTLLSAYETYPDYFDTLHLNIPESNNTIPDILDEALWNIKWMMTMQDDDGGVYHKTTEANFSAFVMPSEVTTTRYVCAKSTAATLDFAAIMAMTARIYKKFDSALADTALKMALKAWQWAKYNPNKAFTNPSASGIYPAITTGEYGDNNFSDEFSWCASELYITTKDDQYYEEIGLNGIYNVPGWSNVKTLGLLSLIIHKDSLTNIADTTLAKSKLTELVTGAKNAILNSPYRIPGEFFYWGGNNTYANLGMLFMQAFRLTKNPAYFNAALASVDYLLGRNATSFCFVTGFGTKSPINIHHRISGSDGIAQPVPGWLVGGPNTGSVSDCGASNYPSTLPAKSYLDMQCSYSTNEIAINWNAPLAFLAGALQHEYVINYTDSMPLFFSLSANKINLPSKSGIEYQITIDANTEWTLYTTSEWIGISANSGYGTSAVKIYSKTDNTEEIPRSGKILVNKNGVLFDSVEVIQNGRSRNFRIEAENYSAMTGLQTETTTDEGGGLNLGYVDINDWVTYNIEVSYTGTYEILFRHAGYAGDFDIFIDDVFFKNVTLPSTAGWQVWKSNSIQLSFLEGFYVMKFKFNKPGLNLNWMQFNWISPLNINQESYSEEIKIYPIPADNILYVEFNSSDGTVAIQLLSTEGKILINYTGAIAFRKSIDIAKVEKGIYILKIIWNKKVITNKIIIY
jgi:endoglucanase